ncbi:unnamed protein product [Prunus armeniaca]
MRNFLFLPKAHDPLEILYEESRFPDMTWKLRIGLYLTIVMSVGCANLTAWCFGPRECALTRDVLLLDAVRLCAGVPVRSTVRRDGDEVRVEDG